MDCPFQVGDIVTTGGLDRHKVRGRGPGTRIHIECVIAPPESRYRVGKVEWVSWRDVEAVTEPIPPAYLIDHAAKAGLSDPQSFRWRYVGVVPDRPTTFARCPHFPVAVIRSMHEPSVREMQALHASGWPVVHERVVKVPSPVMMESHLFSDGQTHKRHHLGQCPDCGAVLWTDVR